VLFLRAPVSGIGSSLRTASLLHAATGHPELFDRLVLTFPPTAWKTPAPQAAMYYAADLVEARVAAGFAELVARAASPSIFRELSGCPPDQEIDEAFMPSVLRGLSASDLPAREVVTGLRMLALILA
jgi:3-oxoadipate enol-lactonase